MPPDETNDETARPPARRGDRVDDADPVRLAAAVDAAIDYRGDVTIVRRSTGASITGFAFDRAPDAPDGPETLRLLPADCAARIAVPIADIAALEFSGRDTAEGRSFETWVRTYVERKLGRAAGAGDGGAAP